MWVTSDASGVLLSDLCCGLFLGECQDEPGVMRLAQWSFFSFLGRNEAHVAVKDAV